LAVDFFNCTVSKLTKVPVPVNRAMIHAGHALLDATGNFTVETHDEYWQQERERLLNDLENP
jgi:hypothetical protein